MAAMRQCGFFLLRYVPDAVKQECVNLGVVLMEEGGAFAGLRFARDLSHVQCLDAAADLEMLRALESDLRTRLAGGPEVRADILRRLNDAFSNVVQLTETKGCLAEDPAAELEALARIYLERPKQPARERKSSARMKVYRAMRGAFEQAGVWDALNKNVAVSRYSPGDPLTIDCGYKPNGTVRLFHAVTMDSGSDTVKALAYSYAGLRDGIRRIENLETDLIAVVADSPSEVSEEREFGMRVLGSAGIGIVPLAGMPEVAERARRELRL